jgi:hypothetical protein
MGLRSFLGLSTFGAVTNGVFNAALGAAAGAAGAAILKASGHHGYDVLESTKMGAIGSGTIGAATGLLGGALASCGVFSVNRDNNNSNESFCGAAIKYTGEQVLGGLVGHAIYNAAIRTTIMDLGRTAAAMAVGAAVTLIPATCATVCIGVPLALCVMYRCMPVEGLESEPLVVDDLSTSTNSVNYLTA